MCTKLATILAPHLRLVTEAVKLMKDYVCSGVDLCCEQVVL